MGILGVKYVGVFFGENHVKLEMKMNSVISGQIFILYHLNIIGCVQKVHLYHKTHTNHLKYAIY